MTLLPVETPQDFLAASQFILPHEITCTTLASLVRRKTDKLVFIKNSDRVVGLLNLDSTIYHCIPDIKLIDENEFTNVIPYLIKKPIRCISGQATASDFLIHIIQTIPQNKLPNDSKFTPSVTYPYKMMKWNKKVSNQISLSGGEEIFRCTENDIDSLKPLQKDYMKDEVAVPGRTITDAEVSITLRQILKNQLCLSLLCDGEPVAKANTNAIGINCIQIGGVYTHPLYRQNGYAAALVQAICNRAFKANKNAVLFVKEKNTPAFNLYQKLGFEECEHYSISYY